MATVDVRAVLSLDPSDPGNASGATAEIDAISEDLVASYGGGTMYFAAGEYLIGSLSNPNPATRTPPVFTGPDIRPFGDVDAFKQGGIRLRSGVDLIGEPGTVLQWASGLSSAMIGSNSPFVWIPAAEPTPEDPGHFVQALIVGEGTLPVGTTTFDVDTTEGFVEGDGVVVRLQSNTGDRVECDWWCFAVVAALDEDTITIDKPTQIPLDLDLEYAIDGGLWWPGRVIRKLESVVEDVTIRNLELVSGAYADEGQTPAQGIFVEYCRNITMQNITGVDPGAGLIVVQYSENSRIDGVHVRSSNKPTTFPVPPVPNYYGRGLSFANAHQVTADNILLEKCRTGPIFAEFGCTQVHLRNVRIVLSHPDQLWDALVFTTVESEVTIDGLSIDGIGKVADSPTPGGIVLAASSDAGGQPLIRIRDLALQPVSKAGDTEDYPAYPLVADLRQVQGPMRFARITDDVGVDRVAQAFGEPRVWSILTPVPRDGVVVRRLPDGLVHRARVFVTEMPVAQLEVLQVELLDDGTPPSAAKTLDLVPRVRVGGMSGTTVGGFAIDMIDSAAVLGSFGYGDQLVNAEGFPYPRQLKVGGGTAVPDGAFVGIELEYFPLWQSVSDSDQGDYDPGDRGLAQTSRWLVDRASTIADGGTTITMSSGNPSVWTDVSFGSPTQYLQVAIGAEPNDLVLVLPSFRLGTESQAVNFDARIVASDNRVSGNGPASFSQSHNGVSGWRALGADGATRVVTGGVTYRVTPDDLDGGVVTFRVSYKMQNVSASRELLASANTPARLDLINLGAAGLA